MRAFGIAFLAFLLWSGAGMAAGTGKRTGNHFIGTYEGEYRKIK